MATDTDEERPHAWCDACDAVLMREGEWNEVSEAHAQVTMVCSGCYDRARARNQR